jgi:hypothetical protein
MDYRDIKWTRRSTPACADSDAGPGSPKSPDRDPDGGFLPSMQPEADLAAPRPIIRRT